jgi:hypothetical protein
MDVFLLTHPSFGKILWAELSVIKYLIGFQMSLIKRLQQLFVNSNYMLQSICFYCLTLCAVFDATR